MLQVFVQLELDQLRDCIEEVAEMLPARVRAFERSTDEYAKGLDAAGREEWYEWNSDRHWQLADVFPKIVHHSLFIAAFAILEQALDRLTSRLQVRTPHAVSLQDLRGQGIDRALVYLKKVQAVRVPNESPEWSRLSAFRQIRNCLVHADGRLKKDDRGRPIRDFLGANPKLGCVDELGRLVLNPTAARDLILTMRAFLKGLFERVAEAQQH